MLEMGQVLVLELMSPEIFKFYHDLYMTSDSSMLTSLSEMWFASFVSIKVMEISIVWTILFLFNKNNAKMADHVLKFPSLRCLLFKNE